MRTRTILAVAVLAGLTFVPRTRAGDDVCSAPKEDKAFRETIRPILSARCGQCHDPGGRMYARLPFDDREVVSSHGAAILRRLKGDDRAAMEKWLAGLAAASEPR
jgi:hypothetical protein